MQELHVPGAGLVLIDHSEVIWTKGYGVADKTTGTPVTQETVFQAASISKSVTAWGIMRLVQEGKLSLDAPVERYLTRWHLPSSSFDNSGVTIRRLLSHTAGLSVPGYLGIAPGNPLPTLEQSLSGEAGAAGNVRVEMPPGSKFSYSGGGYAVLQLVIEEVTHDTFASYMRHEVLQPLGMRRSSFEWAPEIQASTAAAYDQFGNRLPNFLYIEKAAAGLYTTAADLAEFVSAGMTGPNGEVAGRGVLTRETLLQMVSPAPATKGQYGLGFDIQKLPGGLRMVYHPGSNRGWAGMIAELPERRQGLVLLMNGDGGDILATQVVFGFAAESLYRPILWATLCLGALLILLIGGICWQVRHGQREWTWKTKWSWFRIGCIAALALFALTWWRLWFSDVFSRLLTGLSGIIAAESMPWIFRWFSVVLILWCFTGIAVCLTTKVNRRATPSSG
jgi:CubicO group peptidase (beta-lactamase class C family)